MTGQHSEPFDPTSIGDVLVSTVRTVVPAIVGTLLAWLASRGLDLTAYTNATNVVLVPICIAVYYTAARLLERKSPVFGFLLGSRRQPKYALPAEPISPPDGPAEQPLGHFGDDGFGGRT